MSILYMKLMVTGNNSNSYVDNEQFKDIGGDFWLCLLFLPQLGSYSLFDNDLKNL